MDRWTRGWYEVPDMGEYVVRELLYQEIRVLEEECLVGSLVRAVQTRHCGPSGWPAKERAGVGGFDETSVGQVNQ